MESNTKREYKAGGIVKLPPNVKATYSSTDKQILDNVEADDQEHMATVIEYCATTICNKHETVKIFIHDSRHEKTGEILLYTLYMGMPLNTVLEDEHFTCIKQISWRRITRNIKWSYDTEAELFRLEICINPMRCLPEFDDISIVNIHIKQNKRLNVVYEKNAIEDDKRGSTKRPRRESEIDK